MSDINKRFSLDWLADKPAPSSRSADIGMSALGEAVKTYGNPIVKCLSNTDGEEMRVHELIKAVKPGGSFKEFLVAIDLLSNIGMIEIKERDDQTGNHLIHLA